MPDPQEVQAIAHECRLYVNARAELIDPADQDGIGCPVCWPPDGGVPDA